MRKFLLCLTMGLAVFAGQGLAGESAVTVSSAGASLYGTLSMPETGGPDTSKGVPAVLLIAGSGPTDRDGNSTVPGVKPATLKLIADGLAANGIASLRFDKRGIAASAAAMKSEADLHFSDYVDDAVVWTEFLKHQPHVRCVFILGHSEGALIGALAAAKTKICGLISTDGAGFPADEVIMRQIKASGAPEHALEKINAIMAQLRQGKTVADVPPGLAVMFRPSIQPYLISWFPIDPATALGAVSAPILILQGSTDIQVSMEDAQRLQKGAPSAKLVVLDGVNHVLKPAPQEHAANLAAYGEGIALAPKVLPAIVDFVKAHS